MAKKRDKELKINRFNFYLIKSSIANLEDCLKEEEQDEVESFELKASMGIRGKFFLKRNRPRPLAWLKELAAVLEGGGLLVDYFSAFASGVLFVKASNRIFAFVFGGGRNLLRPGCFVSDFGLKVTLNSVDPSKLRTVDTLSLDDNALQTRRQAVGNSGLEAFGIDIEKDYLKAVAGMPDDQKFAVKVAGREALLIHARTDLKNVTELCKESLIRYGKQKYREHFEWIDHLSLVTDAELVLNLNSEAVAMLNDRDTNGAFLAFPEIIAPERQLLFRYSTQVRKDKSEYPDLYIEDFLSTLNQDRAISVEDLKRAKIYFRDSSTQEFTESWRLWDCLTIQIKKKNEMFVLTSGDWHRAKKSFVDDLRTFLASRYLDVHHLPSSRSDEHEEEYNIRAAEELGYVLFDQRTTTIAGASTPVEVCDLFSTDRKLFHLKRKSRSATLSHLFAQGLVSGFALIDAKDFREHARMILQQSGKSKNLIPKQSYLSSNYTIVYGVISKKRGSVDKQIPFFSQLNFRQTARSLERVGYKVKICRIDLAAV